METILRKEIVINKAICRAIGVAVFVVLTMLGAFVRVPLPFTPVPLTLQTMFVLLSGACLGAGFGAVSQLSYLMLGVGGVSVFTYTAAGSLYFFGPTGGYLLGFVLASFLIGRFIKFTRTNLLLTFVLFCLADFILLACGATWLKVVLNINFQKALILGFLPFVAGDLIKAFVAALIFLKLKPRLKEIF